MKLHQPTAEIFVPDRSAAEQALSRTTHMGVGAHADDLEFMALDAILQCYQSSQNWFTGITATDGRGSVRANELARLTDEEVRAVRREEQNKAASLGEYSAMVSLDYSSAAVKQPSFRPILEDLTSLFTASKPAYVYTHNPADKHDTHVAVAIQVIQALRELPEALRPTAVYGCEVWRSLDWLVDEDKVTFDVSEGETISISLMGVFRSQLHGGKRYDLATLGRKRANATYLASHAADRATLLEYAMDLTPLVKDASRDIVDYVLGFVDRFAGDVKTRLWKQLGK